MKYILQYCIVILFPISACIEYQVFSFQPDGFYDENSAKDWVRLNTDLGLPELPEATICTWFKIHFHRYENTMWSFCIVDQNSNLVCNTLTFQSTSTLVLTVSNLNTRLNVSDTYLLDNWNSICFTIKQLNL